MDKEKIFNGTLEKRFQIARKKMSENYNSETVSGFYSVYEDAPLSFILAHSRDIFSDSYQGLNFYASIIESAILDTDVYRREEKKMKVFIGEATNKGMFRNQIEMYYRMHDKINLLIEKYQGLDEIFQNVYATKGGREYVDCIVEELYCAEKLLHSANLSGDKDMLKDANLTLDIIAKSVFTCNSIYASFALGILIVNKHPQYTSQLIQLTDDCLCKDKAITDSAYKRQRVGIGIIKKLMESPYMENFLLTCDNSRLSTLWYTIQNESIDKLCSVPVVKSTDSQLFYTPAADSHNIADLEDFIEDLNDDPSISIEKYDFCKYMAAKLNADLELLGEYDNLDRSKKAMYENMEDLRNYYESEYLMLEWEDDGSPNPIIKKHIMTSKERAAEKEKNQKNESTPINNLEKSTDSEIKKSDAENELCEKINATITEVQKVSPSDDASTISRNKEILSSAKKSFGEYKKEIDDHPEYSRAKALYSKLIEEIKDMDTTMEEFVNEELEGRFDMFFEGIKDDLRATSSFIPKALKKKKSNAFVSLYNTYNKFYNESETDVEIQAKMFKQLFGKDINSINIGSMPGNVTIKIANTKFTFASKSGNAYSRESGGWSKISIPPSCAIYMFDQNKDAICNKLGIESRLLTYIKDFPVYQDDEEKGKAPKDLDEIFKKYHFKGRHIFFNYDGHIGFELDSDIEPEHYIGIAIHPSMTINIGTGDEYIFEDANESSNKSTVSKPNPDFLTRVQNKALDKAAKNSEKYAIRKEKEQKIVNAGKALAEDPKRTGGEVKNFVKKWDSWDENRRKEFLLKPGFRHKIFKNFKVALMYGAVAHVKLAWIPLLGLFRHCSKMKDARIRNEVSRELEAEIKICDEKISDANSKGDNESKYELMRIKEKLEAERSRVRTNSKYV